MTEQWISYAAAARILECSSTQVQRYVERGLLPRRPDHGPGRRPVIDRGGVLALRDALLSEALEVDQRRAQRERDRAVRRRYGGEPPDLEHEWINAVEAARILRITRTGVAKKTARGQLPFTRANGRVWFRREHIEMVARARQQRRRRRAEST